LDCNLSGTGTGRGMGKGHIGATFCNQHGRVHIGEIAGTSTAHLVRLLSHLPGLDRTGRSKSGSSSAPHARTYQSEKVYLLLVQSLLHSYGDTLEVEVGEGSPWKKGSTGLATGTRRSCLVQAHGRSSYPGTTPGDRAAAFGEASQSLRRF
jgi:hypothetical protein